MSPETTQLCTFVVGDLYLGVDVTEVQEVIRFQDMTEVPLAPDTVTGLINLRGQIVIAMDLGRRMGLARPRPERPMNVVVHVGGEAVSLLVDDIDEVVEVGPSEKEPPPPTLRGPVRQLVTATYKLPERLLLSLDTTAAVSVEPAPRGPSERNP